MVPGWHVPHFMGPRGIVLLAAPALEGPTPKGALGIYVYRNTYNINMFYMPRAEEVKGSGLYSSALGAV